LCGHLRPGSFLSGKIRDSEFGDTIPNQKDGSGHVPEFFPVISTINAGIFIPSEDAERFRTRKKKIC